MKASARLNGELDSEDEDGQDEDEDSDSDDALLAGLDDDPEVGGQGDAKSTHLYT